MPAQKTLFDKTADFDGQPYRNVTSLRESEDLFDDLNDGDEGASAIAAEAEMRVKDHLIDRFPENFYRSFHYTRSIIDYPFKSEPYLFTRFGDGTYGIWYGSLEMKTTVFETGFHMIKAELAVEGLDEVVVRERAVYRVRCRAILIDLRGKQKSFPKLLADDYGFTQQIGRRMNKEGHPGILVPSARIKGTNLVIFNPDVLSDPRLHCYLTYFFDPLTLNIRVERSVGRTWLKVDGRKWFERGQQVTVAARCLTVVTDMGIAGAVLSCLEKLSKLNTKSDALFTSHARGGIFILQTMHYPEYIEFLTIQPDDFAVPGLILNAGMPRWIGFTAD